MKVYQKFTNKFTVNLKSLLIFMCKFTALESVNFSSFPLKIQGGKVYLGCKQWGKFTKAVNFLFTSCLLRSLHNAIN